MSTGTYMQERCNHTKQLAALSNGQFYCTINLPGIVPNSWGQDLGQLVRFSLLQLFQLGWERATTSGGIQPQGYRYL